MKLEPLLRAHEFMRIERPPELWEPDTEDVRFLPLLGEMIAAGLTGGASLGDLTLNASNVVVEPDDDPCVRVPAQGEYVAITLKGPADFGPDGTWYPGSASACDILVRLAGRLETAGASYAYVRQLPAQGSFTVFFRRVVGANTAGGMYA